MDCTQSLVDLFSQAFSKVDRRIVKATVLEYGDDIESAITDLLDISDVTKDSAMIDRLRKQCSALLCPSEDGAVEQVSASEEKSEVVVAPPSPTDCKQLGLPSEDAAPDASHLEQDSSSATSSDEDPGNTSPEPSAVNETLPKPPHNIDTTNMASSLQSTVQEARTDIDDVKNLIKEVDDFRAKVKQEQMAAENAELEAGRGGDNVLMQAHEVNKKAQKMKEDNRQLSLEIHGEKSVLSLEFEELNVHVQQMKQQKEKAVTMLNEIRDTLQSFYGTALEKRKRAEEDRHLKEEKAKKVLEQEEDSMAAIVQEAKTLKMETEACALLREFLVDHGSIIDALQGEISRLCDDVTYLKKQVQGVQLSMNTASADQELVALHSLRDSHNSVSAFAGGESSNSLAGQYNTSAAFMGANSQRKSQFLCSSDSGAGSGSGYGSGSHGSMISTVDGFAGFMNKGIWPRSSGVPNQELPYIESSYSSNASWSPMFRFGAGGLNDHASNVGVEPNRFGISHHCSPFCDHAAGFNRNANARGPSHEHTAYGSGGDKQGELPGGHVQFPDQETANMWQQTFGTYGERSNGSHMQGWNSTAHVVPPQRNAPPRNAVLGYYP